jgi:hypothetical protein
MTPDDIQTRYTNLLGLFLAGHDKYSAKPVTSHRFGCYRLF